MIPDHLDDSEGSTKAANHSRVEDLDIEDNLRTVRSPQEPLFLVAIISSFPYLCRN